MHTFSVQQKTTDASSPKSRGGKEGGGKKEKKKGQQGKDKKTVSLQNFQSDGAAGEGMLRPSHPHPLAGWGSLYYTQRGLLQSGAFDSWECCFVVMANQFPELSTTCCICVCSARLLCCHHDNVGLIIGLMSVHKIVIVIILPDIWIAINRLSIQLLLLLF